MREDDLNLADQDMLRRALLPGEECRYMERARVRRWSWISCLEELVEQGFVLTLFFFISAFSALVLWGWLRGSTSTASLLVSSCLIFLPLDLLKGLAAAWLGQRMHKLTLQLG